MIPFIFISIVVILAFIMVYKTFVVTNHNYKQKDSVDQTITELGTFFCKDCKHSIHYFNTEERFLKCKKTSSLRYNEEEDKEYLVTGKKSNIDVLETYYFCSTHRTSTCEGMCGREAKWFEPKEEIKQ